MTFWLFLLRRYRARKTYLETSRILRDLDVSARRDIGVSWLEIRDVARKGALQAVG